MSRQASATEQSGPQQDVHQGLQSWNELALDGCTSAPLASYLKALGVFRLLAQQADPDLRGWWKDDRFRLQTTLSKRDVVNFFLYEYEPTPILSPWSGRAGFLEGESAGVESTRKGARIVRSLESTSAKRFQLYRDLVREAKRNELLVAWDRVTAEKKRLQDERKRKDISATERAAIDARLKELATLENPPNAPSLKERVITSLRSRLPEEAVDWIDTCFAIAEDIRVGALLGTGGNEGSMDFSINHLDTLLEMFDGETGAPDKGVSEALMGSLFGESVRQWKGINPGLLAPASVGGPNMGAGFEGELHENPWDAVFMLEGALFFSATVTRRHGASPGGGLSFPFALAPVNAGHGGVSPSESARPEIWAPIWQRSASIEEIHALFSEGRLTLRRRPARNALDATRAVARLGADRGIDAFERFGFYERRGQGYYVTVPLGRYPVGNRPGARLVDDLDKNGWLSSFRRLATTKGASARLVALIRRVEDAIFAVTADAPGGVGSDTGADPEAVQSLLSALGSAQLYMSKSPQTRMQCPPLPPLGGQWLHGANDRSAEFSIAVALAGLHGFSAPYEGQVRPTLPMAVHFAPLQMHDGSIADKDLASGGSRGRRSWKTAWDDTSEAKNRVVWGTGSLEANLTATLRRRIVEARRLALVDKPFASWSQVPLASIESWILGEMDQQKVAQLLPGLSLLSLAPVEHHAIVEGERGVAARLPLAYVVLKPLFCTDRQLRAVGVLSPDVSLPLPGELVSHIVAGRMHVALGEALRRLRAIGLANHFPDVSGGNVDPHRLASTLMTPITNQGVLALVKRLGFRPDAQGDSGLNPNGESTSPV